MKKLFHIIGGMMAAACLALTTGCNDIDYTNPSEGGIPQASKYEDKIEIIVDQETNEVTFKINAPAVMPVWIFDGTQYSTVNGLRKIYASAGDYEVGIRVMNANGISDGTIYRTFHVDNTIMNFDKYLTFLAGDGSRRWHIDGTVAAHLGCGEPGTDGTNWWSASPGEKADFGLYDNRLAFDKDYKYTFDPGTAGTIYVNIGCTVFTDGGGGDADFCVPVELQEATYSFDVKGEDLFIVFEKGTYFPYIANDQIWDNPRYKVLNMNANTMELVAETEGINWHYILTSKEAVVEPTFEGFKYDSEFNLWKACTVSGFEYYYAPGWAQIADPVTSLSADNSTLTISLPSATFDRWQAQVKLNTDIALTADKTYDLSFIANSSTNGTMKFKFTQKGDDGNFLCEPEIPLTAYEDVVYYLTDVPGINGDPMQLVLDFGGFPDNTEVTIKNIVIKDHAMDDGTVLPAQPTEPDKPAVDWKEDAATNLWRSANYSMFYYYAPGWAQIADPVMTEKDFTYSWMFPSATSDQWQAQVHFCTDMTTSADKRYDFRCVLNSSQDLRGATIKLVLDGDDGVFYFTDRVDLVAYEDYVYTNVDMEGIDMERVKLVFDFGGCPDNTEITLSGVILQEHQGPKEVTWNVDDPNNIWSHDGMDLTWWYAPGWNQIADPVCNFKNNAYTFTLPEATTDRWQAQMVMTTKALHTSADHNYHFHCVLNSSEAFKIMVKLTVNDDDNTFYFADEVMVEPYEDFVFDRLDMPGIDILDPHTVKLVLDFGGCPANSEVTVRDIILLQD